MRCVKLSRRTEGESEKNQREILSLIRHSFPQNMPNIRPGKSAFAVERFRVCGIIALTRYSDKFGDVFHSPKQLANDEAAKTLATEFFRDLNPLEHAFADLLIELGNAGCNNASGLVVSDCQPKGCIVNRTGCVVFKFRFRNTNAVLTAVDMSCEIGRRCF